MSLPIKHVVRLDPLGVGSSMELVQKLVQETLEKAKREGKTTLPSQIWFNFALFDLDTKIAMTCQFRYDDEVA